MENSGPTRTFSFSAVPGHLAPRRLPTRPTFKRPQPIVGSSVDQVEPGSKTASAGAGTGLRPKQLPRCRAPPAPDRPPRPRRGSRLLAGPDDSNAPKTSCERLPAVAACRNPEIADDLRYAAEGTALSPVPAADFDGGHPDGFMTLLSQPTRRHAVAIPHRHRSQ